MKVFLFSAAERKWRLFDLKGFTTYTQVCRWLQTVHRQSNLSYPDEHHAFIQARPRCKHKRAPQFRFFDWQTFRPTNADAVICRIDGHDISPDYDPHFTRRVNPFSLHDECDLLHYIESPRYSTTVFENRTSSPHRRRPAKIENSGSSDERSREETQAQ